MDFDCYVPVIMDFVITYKDFENVLKQKEAQGFIDSLTISQVKSKQNKTTIVVLNVLKSALSSDKMLSQNGY